MPPYFCLTCLPFQYMCECTCPEYIHTFTCKFTYAPTIAKNCTTLKKFAACVYTLCAQELGYCCSIAFVHTNRGTSETVLSHLLIQWYSPHQVSITHTLPSSLSGHTLVTASKLTFYNDRFQPALNPVLDPVQGLVLDPATPIGKVFRDVCMG